MKIKIPFKKSKHFNKLLNNGKIKGWFRISNRDITFNFELEYPKIKESNNVLGVDIGVNDLLNCSDSFQTSENIHGWDMKKIQNELSRKKKGSRAFKKSQEHRRNFVNNSINKLDLDNVGVLRRENIKGLRYKQKSSRMLSHFTYTLIFDKLDDYLHK